MNKDVYYSYDRCFSYQRFFNMLTGGRGIGKTYGLQKILVKRFKTKGEQFIWIRRYKSELKVAKDGFWNKVSVEFPDDKLEIRGNSAYINGKLAGIFVALSTNSTNKGNSKLSNPKTAVFDEYIIDTTTTGQRYLNNEMRVLFDLFETFFRTEVSVKAFFLSNNISSINPMYAYFNINFEEGQKIWIDEDVYCEQCETSENLLKKKMETPMARISKKYDPEYFEYNAQNKALLDNENFIAIKDSKAVQNLVILFPNMDVYIYIGELKGRRVFFAHSKGFRGGTMYTFDLNKCAENILFIDKTELSTPIKNLANAYKRGALYFETQEIKAMMTEELKKFF